LTPKTDQQLLHSQSGVSGGLVADGVTPLLVEIDLAGRSGGTFTVANGVGGGTAPIQLAALVGGTWQTNLPFSVPAGASNAFLYVLPIRGEDVSLSNAQELAVTLTLQDPAAPDLALATNTFRIRKPPVVLVHGYNSDSNTWSSEFLAQLGTTRPSDFIIPVEYGVSYFYAPDGSGPLRDKSANTSGRFDDLARALDAALKAQVEAPLTNWAWTRYDAVGHSQGGVLLRMLCETAPPFAPFSSSSVVSEGNFYRGRFRRVITIGSPHNGSLLVRYLRALKERGFTLPAVLDFIGYVQDKFDPFGEQIHEINSPSAQVDPRIKFNCLTTRVNGGNPPDVGACTWADALLDLCLSPDGQTNSRGKILLPKGSDGVVDFDSQGGGAGTPVAPIYSPDLAHSPPELLFSVSGGQTQTKHPFVAQRVIELLDGPATAFGSFVIPPLLTDPTNVDSLVPTITNANLIVSAPGPLSFQSFYFTIDPPPALAPGSPVTWLAEVFGTNGVTTEGVGLQTSGANNNSVRVNVDDALVGDVVLFAWYASTNGTLVSGNPVLVVSRPASDGLDRIYMLPSSATLSPGDSLIPEVWGVFTNGQIRQLFISPAGAAYSCSNPSVATVDSSGRVRVENFGSATVSVVYRGKTASLSITTIEPVGLPQTRYYFSGPDGGEPQGQLIQCADGKLYGTTVYGGRYGQGTIFRMEPNGTPVTLFSFDGTNGAQPDGGLVEGEGGSLYGTTASSAPYGKSTVFRIDPNGTFTTLTSLDWTNGSYLQAGLVWGPDGSLYGAAPYGGDYARGTLFRVTTNGVLARLISFDGTNGAYPYGALVLGADGNFYGTTANGGTNDQGTVFMLGTNGTLATLVPFNGLNGAYPYASLTKGTDGNFYGTTSGGGANFLGTLFQVTRAGVLTNLLSFKSGNSSPYSPHSGLAEGTDGSFYGTTLYGGAHGYGAVFRAAPDGTLSTLLSFAGTNGSYAYGSVAQGRDRNLYGTTAHGGVGYNGPGTSSGDGTIYQIALFPSVTSPTVSSQPLSRTVPVSGDATFSVHASSASPLGYQWQRNGTVVAGATGSSYTTTNVRASDSGNVFNCTVSNVLGFAVSSNAVLAVLGPTDSGSVFSFAGSDGGEIRGGLVQAADGKFYGATVRGGDYGFGTLFSTTSNGTLSTLVSFNTTNGAYPYAGLLRAGDGDLYGTTAQGGSTGNGTVFRMDTGGTLVTLVSFDNSNGSQPQADLVQGADGFLYGTTAYGGAYGKGTVFKVSTNGVLTRLASFDGTNGAYANSGLLRAADSRLYGVTPYGGANGYGTVFEVTTNGILTTLISFSWTDGAYPQAVLIQGSDGNFYGTTANGGPRGAGTVFRATGSGELSTVGSFDFGNPGPYSPRGGVLRDADGNLYGTTFYGGTAGDGAVFRMAPDGTVLSLFSFNGNNGLGPVAGLVQAADGNLYGTTTYGGVGYDGNTSSGNGTVFRVVLGPPIILAQPLARTVPLGGTANFTVSAVGAASLSYQWFRDGSPIPGANHPAYSLSSVQVSDSGTQFACLVTNSTGSVTSSIAVLTVVGPPSNDACSNAVVISTAPYSTNESTLAASSTGDPIPSCAGLPANGVWFRYTAPADGQLTLDTFGSDFSTVLEVYGGTCGSLNGLGCMGGMGSSTFFASAGATYYILAGGNGGATGSLAFRLSFVTTQATPDETIYQFGGPDGGEPRAGLSQGTDGNLYGTTSYGGNYGFGSIFRITPGGSASIVASFRSTNGAYPYAGLIQGRDGNYYGTTSAGGANGWGTVFTVTTNGVLSALASFNYANGGNPQAGLVQGSDGNLYGTTAYGGVNGQGTIFRVTTNGTLTTLASLNNSSGTYPYAGLAFGPDSALYGTAQSGGANGQGTIFRVTTNGALTTLVPFRGTNGAYPQAGVVLASDGNFYGTASSGGANGGGTVFSLGKDGALTTLYSFGWGDGSNPSAGLFEGSNGNLYGTTAYGGASGYGTAFQVSKTGALTTLLTFAGTNGAYPYASLLQGSDGNFYGTTAYGGVGYNGTPSYNSGDGTVFRISLASVPDAPAIKAQPVNRTIPAGGTGSFSVSALSPWPLSYRWQRDGAAIPDATESSYALTNVQVSDSGSRFSCLVSNAFGSVSTSNAVLTVLERSKSGPLYTFEGPEGGWPFGGLVQGAGGKFYGTTRAGGENGAGTVFSLTTNGELATIASFNYANGASPYGAVTRGADGNLYGTTEQGGSQSAGTVFRVGADGALTLLASLDWSVGADPQASLIQDTDGFLYGTVTQGGANGQGAIFKLSTNGELTSLASLTSASGGSPRGGLVRGNDGSFYGTALVGGPNHRGTVFRVTTAGELTALVSFNYGNGAQPQAGLLLGADGAFYGTTSAGGANGRGTVFKVSTNGALEVLASFDGNSGSFSHSALVQDSWGNLYGTTTQGGANGLGTVFRVTSDGMLLRLYSFAGSDGLGPEAGLVQGSDGNLYGTAPYGGVAYDGRSVSGNGSIFRIVVIGPPIILAQPLSQTVPLGSAVNFTVGASGSSPLTYQWLRNASPLSGATQAAYSLPNLQLSDSGALFSCLITNSFGSATSSNVILTVVPPPSNDACSNAVVIAAVPYTTNELTMAASSAGDPVPSCAWLAANGVWFRYTAPVDGQLVVDDIGSDFDTVLVLYTGNCDALTEIACADDYAPETLTTSVSAGTTYHILAGGYDGATGNLTLHVTLNSISRPAITGTSLDFPNLTIGATGGLAGWTYTVVMSSDLGTPLNQWTPVSTTVLSAGGAFNIAVTNAVSSTAPHRFFILRGAAP
jgi:uncharacterized repeat protein (TIGR03803 family)